MEVAERGFCLSRYLCLLHCTGWKRKVGLGGVRELFRRSLWKCDVEGWDFAWDAVVGGIQFVFQRGNEFDSEWRAGCDSK